uniref:Rhodanese domain-containing protein n=1 Tax=viral metagenome TaxID=1070528 RepID=A0A6C0AZS0_9ZZZZ
MGLSNSIQRINFEDMITAYKKPEVYLLINTLSESEQDCLILNTIIASKEETIINHYMQNNKRIHIIIYGSNSNDEKINKKYEQFIKLGFSNVYIYTGGLFEWLMMQDIYGFSEFPTTTKQLDFIKYKPPSRLHTSFIEN